MRSIDQKALAVLAVIFTMAAAFGCEQKEAARQGYFANKMNRALKDEAEASFESGGGPAAPAEAKKVQTLERMLVVNVTINLEISDLQKSVAGAEAIAKEFGGYISQSSVSQVRENENAQLTIMVPAAKLEQAVERVKKLGELNYESKTTEDVTTQFIDLSARINNLKKEEIALSGLLSRPGKLEEILQVENELSRVRSEIESIQGRLNFLEKETAYSKIFLNLQGQGRPGRFQNWPFGHTLRRAVRAFLFTGRALASIVIWGVVFLPFAILLYILYRILRRSIKRRAAVR